MFYSNTCYVMCYRIHDTCIFYSNEVFVMSNHIGVFIRLHKEHDKKVIERLNEQPNKQGYIKNLILKDSYIKDQYKNKRGNDNG